MDSVGAYEAKTHLSKLLDRVIKGEKIMITKHGVPLAVLQPPAFSRKALPRQVIAEMRQFRDKHPLDGLSIRQMIEEGRR
ncbi:MAG: type II toxin-antitoxin system prevent-host-death family antitoxin [Pseudomonadota bacterium]|nr:type II toxin-antitoxin system prevent-host-death family antitoxin [Pseudomonadota bacterium]